VRKGLEGDTMTTAVIGATGRVGSEIVRGVLERGDAVAALVRNRDKACRVFGEADGLHIRPTRLDDPRDLTEDLPESEKPRPPKRQSDGEFVYSGGPIRPSERRAGSTALPAGGLS
jgi:hypothetical protein